jgi:hypothetical protein
MDHGCGWELIQTAGLSFIILLLWALGILEIRKISRRVERYKVEALEIRNEGQREEIRKKIDFLYQRALKAMRKG